MYDRPCGRSSSATLITSRAANTIPATPGSGNSDGGRNTPPLELKPSTTRVARWWLCVHVGPLMYCSIEISPSTAPPSTIAVRSSRSRWRVGTSSRARK